MRARTGMSGNRAGRGGLRLAVLASLVFHMMACAAIIAAENMPPLPEPESEPQPVALMVEFVTDPATGSEAPQEVREGVSDSAAEEDAAPEANEVVDPTQIERVEEIRPAETPPLPDHIPLPLRRPAPERRKADEKRPDKTELTRAKGIEDEPDPDIETGETLRRADDANAMLAAQMMRGVARSTPAEERWQAQLVAHLQRRKRYPSRALSRRSEGVVHVRFNVEPDGAVMFPELARSSGVPELDEEVLDLVLRAAPVPKPPPGVNSFVTVPVSFEIRR